jgi:cell division protein FtsB
MIEKEYELKWQYVMHTESMRTKFIQWYLTVCAAVFVFIYSDKIYAMDTIIVERRFVFSILVFYSILTSLRLLIQKRNYETYTDRLRDLEGKQNESQNTSEKFFTVFKLEYYIICLVGSVVVVALANEFNVPSIYSIFCGVVYFIITTWLAFTKLINK